MSAKWQVLLALSRLTPLNPCLSLNFASKWLKFSSLSAGKQVRKGQRLDDSLRFVKAKCFKQIADNEVLLALQASCKGKNKPLQVRKIYGKSQNRCRPPPPTQKNPQTRARLLQRETQTLSQGKRAVRTLACLCLPRQTPQEA